MDRPLIKLLEEITDYNDLFKQLDEQNMQLSSLIMDNFRPIPLGDMIDMSTKTFYLHRAINLERITMHLGWKEHTSDWDPYWSITLKDKPTFLTTPGYTASKLLEDHWIIDAPEPNEDEDDPDKRYYNKMTSTWVIPIEHINAICLES
jgi:hypothetical protein